MSGCPRSLPLSSSSSSSSTGGQCVYRMQCTMYNYVRTMRSHVHTHAVSSTPCGREWISGKDERSSPSGSSRVETVGVHRRYELSVASASVSRCLGNAVSVRRPPLISSVRTAPTFLPEETNREQRIVDHRDCGLWPACVRGTDRRLQAWRPQSMQSSESTLAGEAPPQHSRATGLADTWSASASAPGTLSDFRTRWHIGALSVA